ncbi:P2X receptor A-like isoform X2 [Xenia sp. Carnegie-2017]|uniref:P2X receptor A-like isoform X2 n=1 Tax=Xenia sp. Carnegie-2017 TaxID=2897299 RepID=UPI001F03BB0A|nr:P2X receptor A-like isoform X2 [Xenia sp. Carnegie-2017]
MSVFHYATYKYVTIRDSRLGIGYYITAIIIISLTMAEIFINKGYLEFDSYPIGSLRIMLSDPKIDAFNYEPLSKCCIKGSLIDNCTMQCRYLDAQELSWPIQSRTLSVMTFCKERWQSNQQSSIRPEEFLTLREDKFYTLKPEEYVVKVEHTIIATKFHGNHDLKIAGSQRSMKGWLYDANGSRIREMNDGADKLTISELFSAGGVNSLEQVSDALNANGKTYRRHGLVLHVAIKYTNTYDTWFGTGAIQYGYHVSRIPFADYRVNELTPIVQGMNSSEAKSRILRKRYGIKIEFIQAGMLDSVYPCCGYRVVNELHN